MNRADLLQHAVVLPLQDGSRLAVVEVEGLPPAFGGFTMSLEEGLQLVCLSAALPDREREQVILHELTHVVKGHLERDGRPVAEKEAEANRLAADLLDAREQGRTAPELELLRQWTMKRGQVVPLRA